MPHEAVMSQKFSARCMHNKFLLDKSLNTVECGICHKELNPMWVLGQFLNDENRASMRVKELERLAEKAEKKNRCKCQHCKKMTLIQHH